MKQQQLIFAPSSSDRKRTRDEAQINILDPQNLSDLGLIQNVSKMLKPLTGIVFI